ncbi:hypothetical protein CEK28_08560 [Xenophilus sp. AP218F]|nr:hypothetical protein CEK28_08560 [Xenophilus sp. AP218F]
MKQTALQVVPFQTTRQAGQGEALQAIGQLSRLLRRPIDDSISMREFGQQAAAIGCRVRQQGGALVLVPQLKIIGGTHA